MAVRLNGIKKKSQENLYRHKPNLILDSTIENRRQDVVWIDGFFRMKQITSSLAWRQTGREIVSNAIDNVRRAMNPPNGEEKIDPGIIDVNFEDVPKGEMPIVTISNGGHAPPLGMHEEGVPAPQVIWGMLNSSTNYDDDEERRTGGQNGIGAKGCNLFSEFFIITINSATEGKTYYQEFHEFVPNEPIITKYTGKKSKVTVSYKLNDVLGKANIDWFAWDVICAAVSGAPKVRLTTRGKTHEFFGLNLEDFLKFYPPIEEEKPEEEEAEEQVSEKSEESEEAVEEEAVEEVIDPEVAPKEQRHRRQKKKKEVQKKKKEEKKNFNGPTQPIVLCHWKDAQGNEVIVADVHRDFNFPMIHGWVNGLPCSKGAHIDAAKPIFAKAFEKLLLSTKDGQEKLAKYRTKEFPAFIKSNVLFLVKVEGPDPNFGAGQIKGDFNCFRILTGEDEKGRKIYDNLSPDLSMFDPEAKSNPLGKEQVKWGDWKNSRLMQALENVWRGEAEKILLKTDGKKTKHLAGEHLKKIEDANFAGTKDSHLAALIAGEGDSALEYLREWVAQDKGGRDIWGLIPFRGKLINSYNCSFEDLAENLEIIMLKAALGLQEGLNYEVQSNFSLLRYQRGFYISTDGDDDGQHIRGLILLYFYQRFPSLIKRGFVKANFSPAVRIHLKNEILRFYKFEAYLKWLHDESASQAELAKRSKTKADFLKGLGSSDAKDIIDDFRINRTVTYRLDPETEKSIQLAFDKDYSDERKNWLLSNNGVPDDIDQEEQDITRFIHDDLIVFYHKSIYRAIQKREDSFKEVQRKLIWALYNEKDMTKLMTLAATAVKETQYHHGDAIAASLVKMTQIYTGSAYNLPYFVGKGRFGSRASGGKSAKLRYIAAKISPITAKIFPKEDFPLLTMQVEEGKQIEPEFLLSVIPLCVVNGALGISTGWSSFIPSYDPKAVIGNVRRLLTGKTFQKMIPWYRGYEGTIELTDDGFISRGTMVKFGRQWRITELPLFVWTNDYEKKLKDYLEDKKIKDMKNNSKPETVNFTVMGPTPELLEVNMEETSEEDWEKIIFKFFGLQSTHSMKNMVLIKDGKPYKYDTVEEIFTDFIDFRLPFYEKRREYVIRELQREIEKFRQQLILLRLISEKKVHPSDDNLIERAIELNDTLTEVVIEDILDKHMLRSVRPDGFKKMENKLETMIEKLNQLENSSPIDLWLEDLKSLEKSL
jgi:DNA gyrase/topoisomerase IV subunit B